MDINEIKTYFETNKENNDVKAFVTGLNPINLDRVKDFVGKDKDAMSWFDSEKDKHSSKSLETWRTNNLSKLLDDEIKKRFPEADPKDTELSKLKAEIEKMQKDATRKDLTNKALKIASEKKLPSDIIDFFIADDEKNTNDNITKLETSFNNALKAAVEEKLKGGTPRAGGGTDNNSVQEIFKNSLNNY